LAPIAGQIVERSYPTGVVYGIRLGLGDRRVYLALGHQRDGWNAELANRVLLVVTAACRAQERAGHHRRWRRERG
jgi:hypothetical protein